MNRFIPVPEACETSGIKKSKLYELIAIGEIKSVKIGRARRISLASLQEWMERLVSEQNQG